MNLSSEKFGWPSKIQQSLRQIYYRTMNNFSVDSANMSFFIIKHFLAISLGPQYHSIRILPLFISYQTKGPSNIPNSRVIDDTTIFLRDQKYDLKQAYL
jgi:hypothetical protein